MSRRRIPFEIDDPTDQENSKLIEKQQDQLFETPKIGRAHVELQSHSDLVCRLLLAKKKKTKTRF